MDINLSYSREASKSLSSHLQGGTGQRFFDISWSNSRTWVPSSFAQALGHSWGAFLWGLCSSWAKSRMLQPVGFPGEVQLRGAWQVPPHSLCRLGTCVALLCSHQRPLVAAGINNMNSRRLCTRIRAVWIIT